MPQQKIMAKEFINLGYKVISDGTDSHLMVVDMTSKDLSGKDAESVLERVGISVSRSTIPNDPNPPMNPSGVRFGTPAITTRGMKEEEIKKIVLWVDSAIAHREEVEVLDSIQKEVKDMCLNFPIPSI